MENGRIFEDQLLPHIRKACAHSGGRFSPEGCIRRWLDGQWLMWAINSPQGQCAAVFFTQLNVYQDTGLRTLEVALLGGSKVRAWIHLEPLLLQYAESFGCERVEAWSRSGLIDLLPRWRRNYLLEIDTKRAEPAAQLAA
jgi:hypothetical protein